MILKPKPALLADCRESMQLKSANTLHLSNPGFTLVEIIIALVIASIMAAVVIGRFSSGNSFNGLVIRDQFIALARMAQQSALGRADVELRVTPNGSGSEATITVSEANGTMQTATLPLTSVSLTTDTNVTTSCGVTPGANSLGAGSAPLVLEFGELGDVLTAGLAGSPVTVSSAVRLCIDGDVSRSVCVSSAGFAYIGDCDVD